MIPARYAPAVIDPNLPTDSSPETPASPGAPTPDSAPAVEPGSPAPMPAPMSIVRLALGFYGIVTLFAVGYVVFSTDTAPGLIFGEKALTLPGLFAGIGIGLVIVGITRVGVRIWPAIEDATRELAVMIGPLTSKQAIWLGLMSGLAEELLFRGALWAHMGLLGTTCLFALVHVIPKRQLWGYPLFAAGAGLILGVLRMGTGSVFPAVLAHMTVNCVNLVWMAKRYPTLARLEAADRIAQEADGR